jgi:hypothetical protein
MGVYLTYREVMGHSATYAQITKRLVGMKLESLLQHIASMNNSFLFAMRTGTAEPLNRILVQHSFHPDIAKKVLEARQNRGGIAIHRQQQLMMLCEAMLSCDNETGTWGTEQIYDYSEASLMMSDFTGAEQIAEEPNFLGVVSQMLPIFDLYTDNAIANIVSRAAALWIDYVEESHTPHSKLYRETFEAKYGITIRSFLIVVFFCSLYVEQFDPHKVDFGHLWIDQKSLITTTNFPPEVFDKAFGLIKQSRDELISTLLTKPRQSVRYDFTFLRSRPFLEVKPERYLCLDQEFVRRLFTDRVYWLIREALPFEKRGDFDAFFGGLVERYAGDLLQIAFGKVSDQCLYFSPRFQGNDELCDILSVSDNTWALI